MVYRTIHLNFLSIMAFVDIFIGAPQSKWAGIFIIAALVAVAVAMLFGKDNLPMGQKFVAILLMFLVALPGLLLSLFQLTCLVTGSGGPGLKGKTWWCGGYAWLGTIIVFLYAMVIVALAIMSINSGTDITVALSAMNAEGFEAANRIARERFQDLDPEEVKKMMATMTTEEFQDMVATGEIAAAVKRATDTAAATGGPEKAVEAFQDMHSLMVAKGMTPEMFENMKKDILGEVAAEEEAAVAAAKKPEMPAVPTVAPEVAVPPKAPAAEGFQNYPATTVGHGKVGAAPEPSEPETFTSCGAPLF